MFSMVNKITQKLLKLFVLVMCLNVVATQHRCFQGTFAYTPRLRGRDVCELCPDGTFMPLKDHDYRECFSCTEIKDPALEILVTPCNRTQNTVIHCIDGYFRQLPRNPREQEKCVKCTECDYPILSCGTYSDTHCCQGENYDVVLNRDGVPVCWEKPWLCRIRKGQYFHEPSFNCRPCPDDTFMPLDYHTVTECFKCPTSSALHLPHHVIIIQPCNSTHPTLTGCENGYYIDHHMGHWDNIGCALCKNCSKGTYEGRECTDNHDRVCCPQPNMTVVDTQQGPQCVEPFSDLSTSTTDAMPVCAEDQFLQRESGDHSATCKPCPDGTYMDEPNHTNTACKHSGNLTKAQLSSAYTSNKTVCVSAENGNFVVAGAAGFAIGFILCVCFLLCGAFTARRYLIMSLNLLDRSSQAPDQDGRIMEEGDPGEVEACLKRSP